MRTYANGRALYVNADRLLPLTAAQNRCSGFLKIHDYEENVRRRAFFEAFLETAPRRPQLAHSSRTETEQECAL
jgi:hypothetical protein